MSADSPAPDPLAAELAAIEYRQENGDLRDFVTHDSPRLLAAVEAALEHHEPVDDGRWHTTVCGRCRETWPCGEVQAISAALAGKEDDRG